METKNEKAIKPGSGLLGILVILILLGLPVALYGLTGNEKSFAWYFLTGILALLCFNGFAIVD
ncbi:MAG: hypothetical protein ACPF8V_12265, partial [Luteibaculum sp.]